MPPRYVYWTILIDQKPTAFRAKDREELLPTFAQLQRTNSDVVMKWFARGRLWDSPEQAQWTQLNVPKASEQRGPAWRPGGQHRDPRARFDKSRFETPKPKRDDRRPWENRDRRTGRTSDPPKTDAPGPANPQTQPPFERKPRRDRPKPETWRRKPDPAFAKAPEGTPGQERPRFGGLTSDRRPRPDRPWADRAKSDRPWSPKPSQGSKTETRRQKPERPWRDRPKPETWRRTPDRGPKGPKKRG